MLENIAIIVVQTLGGKSMNLGNNLFDARKKKWAFTRRSC